MYTGFKVNTSINKSVTSGLNETQLETLQRQVDSYTRKLQQQKRKFFSIQDTYKSVSQEFDKEKSKLNELKKQNSKAQNVMLQAKIKNLEANLDKAISTYDDTVAYNNKLKDDIDMLRRQKKNYLEMQKSLEEQITKLEDDSDKKMQLIEKKKKKADDLKNEIVQIKLKNEEQRQTYMKQFDTLEKQYIKEKKQRQQTKILDKHFKPQSIDTQPLLRHRLKKILNSNKQKMKMIEQYKKHMKMIEEAFNDIKSKSGIQDLNQITNTFIKSQEQNYSLYNYMDILSQNIDSLEEANQELQQKIKYQQVQNDIKRKKMTSTPQQQKKRKQLQNFLSQKEQINKQLHELLAAISPFVQSTLIELSKSNIVENPKKATDYELGFHITEKTVEEYLADLEKYINTLLLIRQQAKTKVVNNLKDNITNYTKQAPTLNTEEVKDKMNDFKQDNKFLETNKFRQYATQYWQRRKNKGKD